MNYLIIKKNNITKICESDKNLLNYLNVKIEKNGIINVGNKEKLPFSYCMKTYTKEEIEKDLIKCQLKWIECLLQIAIYTLKRVN